MKTMILIPSYNAAETLEAVINRVPVKFRSDLTVIDDGSQDCTKQILKEKRINSISHPKNLGYGAAQKTGITFSLKHGCDAVVILHADGQYPPEKIPELVSPIYKKEADIVIGSRMLRYSRRNEMPVLRNLGNRFLTFLENLVLKSSLTGFHCGFRAYSCRFLRSIDYMTNSNGFEFDSEIIFQALFNGFRVKEIPIDAHYGQEMSHLKPLRYGFSVLGVVLKFMLHKDAMTRVKCASPNRCLECAS